MQKATTARCMAWLILLSCLLTACGDSSDVAALYFDVPFFQLANISGDILPGRTAVHQQEDVWDDVRRGAAAESFEIQAWAAGQMGIASQWTPLYAATVIIAVDRDQTDAAIDGWNDLLLSQLPVGLIGIAPLTGLTTAAIEHGLKGEVRTFDHAAEWLAQLYARDRLLLDQTDTPLLICFDHQAVAMKKAGYSIEIVVPEEGTLSYLVGMLSAAPADIGDVGQTLVSAGFRLPDGTCDETLYPAPSAYLRAETAEDFAQLNSLLYNMTIILRRTITRVRLYSSAGQHENQIFALGSMLLIALWTAMIIHRVMQRGVRRLALIIGLLLAGWVMLRIIKYEFPVTNTFIRYCWYAFYVFQLGVPLIALRMAWVIDKPDPPPSPRWWRYTAIVHAALLLAVLTNDLHQLAFRFDTTTGTWEGNYTYGPVYFLVVATVCIDVLLAQIIMARKNRQASRRIGIALQIGLFSLLLVYVIANAARHPLAWGTDITIVTGIYTMLFIEVCISIGYVPVNTHYRQLFAASPQHMRILDDAGQTALASRSSETIDVETWRKLKAKISPLSLDDDTLLFADAIPGGMVVCQEDIGNIHRLQADIAASMKKIKAANNILRQEEAIRGGLAASQARVALFTELELEIRRHAGCLSDMLHAIPDDDEARTPYLARVALLVCYIKRRCNLFFIERESEQTAADELAVYMDELGEFAGYTGVQCLSVCGLTGSIALRQATIMYDLYFAVLFWVSQCDGGRMFLQILEERNGITMRLMTSGNIADFALDPVIAAEAMAAGGRISKKELMDAVGITASFPKGGMAHE